MTHTARFVLDLEEQLGFKIHKVQTDNGPEFVNNQEISQKKTVFEEALECLGIRYQNTRPYSPWQNGKVERSHREDQRRFYDKQVFTSVDEMMKKHKRYITRQNNVVRKILSFKSPNQVVEEYFSTVAS